jgi:hypothetical protein
MMVLLNCGDFRTSRLRQLPPMSFRGLQELQFPKRLIWQNLDICLVSASKSFISWIASGQRSLSSTQVYERIVANIWKEFGDFNKKRMKRCLRSSTTLPRHCNWIDSGIGFRDCKSEDVPFSAMSPHLNSAHVQPMYKQVFDCKSQSYARHYRG